MLILSKTFRTFDCKVNKIKSLAKKKYYLHKTLKDINKSIKLTLWTIDFDKKQYREMIHKNPIAKDQGILRHIKYNMFYCLPEQKIFRSHVLEKIAELER